MNGDFGSVGKVLKVPVSKLGCGLCDMRRMLRSDLTGNCSVLGLTRDISVEKSLVKPKGFLKYRPSHRSEQTFACLSSNDLFLFTFGYS